MNLQITKKLNVIDGGTHWKKTTSFSQADGATESGMSRHE